ncbi:MAG: hypothetical protein E7470_06810 [Ruminococcaceae bacterium]|nr:hypothetical protein [Oscillospiraceae bacterium]
MSHKTLRPIPFYFLTTSDEAELSYEKAYESLSTLKARGFGGAVLFNKPPHGFNAEEYLSDKWFRVIENFIKAGITLDLEMWINDGFDYPPGAAAGKVKKVDPSLVMYKLARVDGVPTPVAVDWGFPAFENPRSSALFLEIVYEAYKKHLGQYFGKGIRGFFSDADNRRVNANVFTDPNTKQKDYFPWSEDFRDTFKAKFGYDIWDYIDEVLDRKDTAHAVDYWQHCGDLYCQWFRGNYEWCKANDLEYTFHTSDTSPFGYDVMARSSAFTEGRFCDVESNADYCGTDQELLELNGGKHYTKGLLYTPKVSWGNTAGCRRSAEYYDLWGDVRTKQAQSTAFIYDKPGAMCEMFAATNYGATYEELREVAAFQIMQGITFIIPHAYQYRVHSQTKYFAPPDFSDKGHLPYCRAFNDTLVQYLSQSTKGSLDAPVAVLDITEDLWRHRGNYNLFMDVCHQLNRRPFGYVIATASGIEKKKDAIKLVLNTGVEKLDSIAGIPVVNIGSIDELDPALNPLTPVVRYEGMGTPHFMVRNTDRGQCALIANIENEGEILGKVFFGGKEYPISLFSGEVAFFSEEEQHYRAPTNAIESTPLATVCPVTWERENVLPIAGWLDENGNTVIQSEDADVLRFEFQADASMQELTFYVPANSLDAIEKIEGVDMGSARRVTFLDDPYVCYTVKTYSGLNVISITKNAPIHYSERFFLMGDFDLDIDAEDPFYKQFFYTYNLTTFVPKKIHVTLKPRSQVLRTDLSAALQGHPFYMGGVTYHMEAYIPGDGSYQLHIPNAYNGVSVRMNDGETQELLFRPFILPCPAGGKCKLDLTTYATYANFMELYPREFGLTDGVLIEKL